MVFKNMRSLMACAILFVASGCDMLDVADPTALGDDAVTTPVAAEYFARDVIAKLYFALGEWVYHSGVLSDEFFGGDEFTDKRSRTYGGAYPAYTAFKEVQSAATLAIPLLLQHQRGPRAGEMFALRGYALLGLAESFCSGFPVHDIVEFKPAYGPPLNTDEVLERALADFDSATAYAADSSRILSLARIGRGRALLGLGRYAEAAGATREVPTSYNWNAEYSTDFSYRNRLGGSSQSGQMISVSNMEGDNGLNFIDANDPRLKVRIFRRFLTTDYYLAEKIGTPNAPIIMASGVEARLIEAEAALAKGDQTWLAILNDLRTQSDPAMSPLEDPGTDTARVDMVFRERAFWLFATAHRLGDLRRLIVRYGRAAENLFPSGVFYRYGLVEFPDGVYDTATALRFPVELEASLNPAVTGCTDQ